MEKMCDEKTSEISILCKCAAHYNVQLHTLKTLVLVNTCMEENKLLIDNID